MEKLQIFPRVNLKAFANIVFVLTIAGHTSLSRSQEPEVVVPNPIGADDRSPSDTRASNADSAESKSSASKPAAPKSSTARSSTTESKAATAKSTQSKSAQSAAKKSSADKEEDEKPLTASAKDPFARDIQNIALRAQKQLSESALPKVEVERKKLLGAIDRLENFLKTNPKSRESWRRFLQLDAMREEAEKDKPSFATLTDLEMAMRQNYLGLEFQPYVQVRESLSDFRFAIRWGANAEQSLQLLDTRLERLVETLNEPVSDAEMNEAVGVIALYLEQSHQAPSSLAAIRAKYSQPNVQAYVPESFVTRMLARPVAQPTSVNECLLGTRVVGAASLNGSVTADLMPSPNGVSLCLNLNANMSTNSTGYNRGVVLRSTGASPVHASKQIFVTPTGISSTPASVATNLQTQINSIEHRSRIVRRIATRKAAETQPQANRVAEGRLQTRVQSQFDQQVESQLSQSRVQLASFQKRAQSRPELRRIGLEKPTYSYNSSTSAVHAIATERNPSQLAAPRPSPLPQPANGQVFIDAHESLVMNAIDVFLSGRTIRNSELDELVKQVGGKVTPELQKEADGEPWSITFASVHPVLIEMNDGLVKISLRISKMTRGEQVLNQDTVVTATYRPSISNGYFRMDREGEMEINFIGRGGLGSVSLKPFIKGKFEKTFKPVLVNTPIQLPLPANRSMPQLQIAGLQLDNGWVQVSLR